jgi:hypothetical protein
VGGRAHQVSPAVPFVALRRIDRLPASIKEEEFPEELAKSEVEREWYVVRDIFALDGVQQKQECLDV